MRAIHIITSIILAAPLLAIRAQANESAWILLADSTRVESMRADLADSLGVEDTTVTDSMVGDRLISLGDSSDVYQATMIDSASTVVIRDHAGQEINRIVVDPDDSLWERYADVAVRATR